MGRSTKWKHAAASRDAGGFVALPWAVLDSPAYQALSHPSKALLMEFARQYVRDNNGRLLASGTYLAQRGWTSNSVITRAKKELMDAGFIYETVKGQRPNKASWYAITWCALDHLDGFDPGARSGFQRGAYRQNQALLAIKPTLKPKAKTMPKQDTNGYVLTPPDGATPSPIAPRDGVGSAATTPPDGAIRGTFEHSSTPPDGDHLEEPSTPDQQEGRGQGREDAKTAAAQREQRSMDSQIEHGRYLRLMARPKRLFTRLLDEYHQGDDGQGMQVARVAIQRTAQAAGKAVAS